METKELTFMERLLDEKDKLKEKLDKLNDFIEKNPEFNNISNIQRILLINQYNSMQMYYFSLESRIEYIND